MHRIKSSFIDPYDLKTDEFGEKYSFNRKYVVAGVTNDAVILYRVTSSGTIIAYGKQNFEEFLVNTKNIQYLLSKLYYR